MPINDSIDVLVNVTTGTSNPFPLQHYQRVGGSAAFATGVTAGEIVVETAPTAEYAGTWSEAMRLTFSGTAPNVITDAVECAANFGRARIVTPIAGGGDPKVIVTVNRICTR